MIIVLFLTISAAEKYFKFSLG